MKRSTVGLTLVLITLERHPHHNRLSEFVATILSGLGLPVVQLKLIIYRHLSHLSLHDQDSSGNLLEAAEEGLHS